MKKKPPGLAFTLQEHINGFISFKKLDANLQNDVSVFCHDQF